jgi:hypothetical protein
MYRAQGKRIARYITVYYDEKQEKYDPTVGIEKV